MKDKTTRHLFSASGLALIIIGVICVGVVAASYGTTNLVKLSEFGDNYVQVSLSQTATTIMLSQSATFSVTVQSLDSGYSIESVSAIWYIDGTLVGTDSSSLTFTGASIGGVGQHTVSCTVTVSYIADGGVSYNQGYYPSGTVLVQSTSSTAPTPIGQTPTPTPYGQTPTPTGHPTVNPTPHVSSNPTNQTLLAVMGGLFIGAGAFLVWSKQYF